MKKILFIIMLIFSQFLILHCSDRQNNKDLIQKLKIRQSDKKQKYRTANEILHSFECQEKENPEENIENNSEENIENNPEKNIENNIKKIKEKLKFLKHGGKHSKSEFFLNLVNRTQEIIKTE